MCDIVRFSAEEYQLVEMSQCVWPETFNDSPRRGFLKKNQNAPRPSDVCLVANYRRRLVLLIIVNCLSVTAGVTTWGGT